MIDIEHEKLITLDDAVKFAPGFNGKCASMAAIRSWATRGMRGVRLETIFAGGRRCTSPEAVQRFFEALTRARDGGHPHFTPSASHNQAMASLRAQGLVS